MSDDRTNDTDLATDLAAQVWCAPECSECVMDVRLATEFARVLRNWLDFAEQQQRNATYYRGIVQEIGEPFGIESRTSDDGSVQDEVLILKVPELVATLRAQLADMTAERDAANKQTLITEEALENACRLIPGGVLRAAGCHVSEGADTSQWFVDRAYLALEQTR